MNILGDSVQLKKFLQNLDQRKLVDLCSDILVTLGHNNIRITDGPGDGQRDIYSEDPLGNGYLTQSKFHANISQTVSSKELGEVVLGMVKHGYKRGCFVTNAKISPQAKRECLNDYPGYSIDYLDGREIVKKVFESLILKAIWYDGDSIDQISYEVIVPLLVRDLVIDKLIHIFESQSENAFEGEDIDINDTHVRTYFQRKLLYTTVFEPYSLPKVRTSSDQQIYYGFHVEVTLTGTNLLKNLSDVVLQVGKQIIDRIQRLYGERKQHVAIRIGNTYLKPLGGQSRNERIDLDYPPFTLVLHGDDIAFEWDWLLPSQNSGLIVPNTIRGSQGNDLCFYDPIQNSAIKFTIIGAPDQSQRWMLKELYDYKMRWWTRSLFLLVPKILQGSLFEINDLPWDAMNLHHPNYLFDWNSDQYFCLWIHPKYMSPMLTPNILMDEYPDSDENDLLFFTDEEPESVKSLFKDIEKTITDIGGSKVTPEKARHMVAVMDEDPFPIFEDIEYPVSYFFTTGYQDIPSPVDPRKRVIEIMICWFLEPLDNTKASNENQIETLEYDIKSLIQNITNEQGLPFYTDMRLFSSELNSYICIILELRFNGFVGFERTDEVLINVKNLATPLIDEVENQLIDKFDNIARATGKYLQNELYLDFVLNQAD